MVLKEDLVKEWYRPGEIAKLLNVTSRTILNYKDSGLFNMRLDKTTNRWYASKEEVIKLLKIKGVYYEEEIPKITLIYARVSSTDQKKNGDLSRQIQRLIDYCIEENIDLYEIYYDIGSGLNAKRGGLFKLIDRVMYGNIDKVIITYKDRLTRFGYEYLEKFFSYFGVEIIVLNETTNKTEQEELIDDMMSLLASFSGKLYGMRSRKKKEAKDFIDSIPEE